jgi:hypothetical protein
MDGHLGDLECVASDHPLPEGNRCSRSGEPTVHVFFIALCTHPLPILSLTELANLTRFRFLAFRHLRFVILLSLFLLSFSLSCLCAAFRREEMEPGCGMADI